MAQFRVAILGASGIGKFHFREFVRAGTDVTSILGSSRESAEKTADVLAREFDLRLRAYFELDTLLASERLDAVSICTPPELHYDQAKKCLSAGLHVLCEKPFVLNSASNNSHLAAELIELAKKQRRIISVNTQWPSVLGALQPFVGISKVNDFFMYSQPGTRGKAMLADHLPHANSILVRLIPAGHAEEIRFSVSSAEEIDVYFKYKRDTLSCTVHYKFKFKADRPRDLKFSINGVEFKRKIGEGYRQRIVTGTTEIDIEDPFKVSIEMFIGAIASKNLPLISAQEIIENMQLQDKIIKAYASKDEE